MDGLNIGALMKAKAIAAQLEQKHRPPKQWGESNKEVHQEAFPDPIESKEEKMVRVDEVIRDLWKVKFIKDSKGIEEVPAKVLEPDLKREGNKKPKLAKKKPTRKGIKEVKKQVLRIDGKMVEVDVKVLQDGNEYFVGKNPPSGMAPWGTRDTEEKARTKVTKKLYGYIERRSESAWDAESQGRQRKGGSYEEYQEVLVNLQKEAAANGIEIEEI